MFFWQFGRDQQSAVTLIYKSSQRRKAVKTQMMGNYFRPKREVLASTAASKGLSVSISTQAKRKTSEKKDHKPALT